MWIVNRPNFLLLLKTDYLIFSIGGVLLSAAHPPLSIPYVTVLVLASIGQYWYRKKPNHGESFLCGWLFGLGYFSFSLVWIIEPFLVKPHETAIFAPFALILLTASLSIFWGFAFWGASLKNDYGSKFWSLVQLAAFLSLAELLRSFIFSGFPWVILGIAFVDTSLGQNLSLFGPYWLTSLIIFLSFISLSGFRGVLISLIGFMALFFYGESRFKDIENLEPTVKVRVVQPNIDQRLKWKPELSALHLEKLFDLSTDNLELVDLVIWPETAIQLFLENQEDFSHQVSEEIGKPIILGARKYVRERHELFNSAYVLDHLGQIQNSYDKKHLVPFGEYVPFSSLMSKLGVKIFTSNGISGFTVGQRQSQMRADGKIPPFTIMICYESIFSYEVDESTLGVDWLIHLTNDAWFGSYSGPQQHLMHSQARAIEQGLPLIRSANTGISVLIDPYGRIIRRLDLNVEGHFDADLSKKLDFTIYSIWGAKNWNSLLFSLIVLTIFLCLKKTRNSVNI